MFDLAAHIEAMTDAEIIDTINRAKRAGGAVVSVALTVATAGGPAATRRRAAALVRRFQEGATLSKAERVAYGLLEQLVTEGQPKAQKGGA